MGRSAIEALGHTRDQAERMISAFNEKDRESMLIAAEHYDPNIPAHENENYTQQIRESRGDWEADLEARMKAIMSES